MFNSRTHKKAQLEDVPSLDPAVDDILMDDAFIGEEVQDDVVADDLSSQLDIILKKNMANHAELEESLNEAYDVAINSPEAGDSDNAFNFIKAIFVDIFPNDQDNVSDALRLYTNSKESELDTGEIDSIEKEDALHEIYKAYVQEGLGESTGPDEEVVEDVVVEDIPGELEGEPELIEEPVALASEEGKMKKSFNFKEQKTASVEKKSDTDKMQKTAGGWGGGGTTHSIMYGPEEKRYCPKLRNVISLFNCRYYCLDGMVIDDNKVICGEAVWRQNLMDKYSRAYRNKEGEWVGGYVDKRFEVHHDTEDPQYQLKPGERRRPLRTDEFSTERRLAKQREGDLPESIAPREKTAYNHKKKKVANMAAVEEISVPPNWKSGSCPGCNSTLDPGKTNQCPNCGAEMQGGRWFRPMRAEPGAINAPQGTPSTNINMDSPQGQQLGKQMSNNNMTKETEEDWDREDEAKPVRKLTPQEEARVKQKTFESVGGFE